ncbi:protein claret segregational [Amyelois transitella]|uniref:protein claret segregational n=1 Tax=Amyelois transitella TaxID=680683 RepID=UPI00067B46E0|nr:protein claret segregational [Amyelois transitella]XP_060800371.1 protein claret segregational [Amyelois transitella]
MNKMSRIPKLPIAAAKENRPGLLNNRPITRTIVNGLSDADKKSLIQNHTRPMRTGPGVTLPAQRLKRSATVPSAAQPTKVTKVERKPATVAPKIPPYDYKARFNDLLEKHKVIKSEFNDLKDKHVEVSDEYEKVKESVHSCTSERDILKEKLLNTLNDLREKTSEFERIKVDYDIQKHENESLHRKSQILEEVTKSLKKKTAELEELQTDFNNLTRRHNSLKEETEALRVLSEHLKKVSVEYDKLQLDFKEAQEAIVKYKTEAEALQNILASMYREQRDLRNTIQDLKGNIRVYCRIRPPLESEMTKALFNLNVIDACSIEVEKVELNFSSARKGKSQHAFTFDGIFTPHASQEDVFAEVSPMVQSALDGYNVCIFAYGQTGSGKTYTMEGGCGTEQYGIIPRAFNMIFTSMEDLKRMGWELTIRASFLEIYNEVIYDLLNSSKDQESHEIKMVNSKGIDVYVSNLKEEEVKSSHDFIRLMIFAQRNRQTAATLNNERSSRSHSVAQIKISAIHEKRKEKFTSHLNLVDLAGSESGKTTQRMDETKHINRSLSELSKVILSLQTNQSHIPYRNSKLTHLLMPSLGGNSKTLMLVNVNQFDECFNETLNSLRFATKVNNCRVIKAKKNLTMVDTL